jgi:Helix-turn-helix of DDE superfamily endonuclease
MAGLRFADVMDRPNGVLDFTSLTVEEFRTLVEPFEQAFHTHMADWRLDGKPRTKRAYSTYENCPLPTAEDRLLFILSYLKSNALQVFHGQLFGMRQNKANQWIHTLLPVLRATFVAGGDAPSRTLDDLARRLGMSRQTVEEVLTDAVPATTVTDPTAPHPADPPGAPPLFAMMAPNDLSLAPKMRQNRKVAIAARKSATR